MRQRAFKPQPEHDPWRRLMAKIVERAVLDLCGATQPNWEQITAITFLTDEAVRSLCDAWGLWLPWTKMRRLANEKAGQPDHASLVRPE